MKAVVLNLVPNTIGDSIIMLPLFRILKKKYKHISATADKVTYELWQDNKEIDELILVPELSVIGDRKTGKGKKTVAYLKLMSSLIARFKKERYDACFVAFPNFFLMPLIPYISGIKERVGFTYSGSSFSFLLTKKASSQILFDRNYERHILESFLDLARADDISFTEKDKICRKEVTRETINAAHKKLLAKGVKRRFISVHTLSKLVSKNWPKERFRELTTQLSSKFDIALLGSPSEKEYNDFFIKDHVYNLCGAFSLGEVGGVLKNSELFIGNDSGLAHYSSSVGTKTLVIFGSTSPSQAKPLGYGETKVLFNNKPKDTYKSQKEGNIAADIEAMKSIGVEEVMTAATDLLSSGH